MIYGLKGLLETFSNQDDHRRLLSGFFDDFVDHFLVQDYKRLTTRNNSDEAGILFPVAATVADNAQAGLDLRRFSAQLPEKARPSRIASAASHPCCAVIRNGPIEAIGIWDGCVSSPRSRRPTRSTRYVPI